MLLSFVDPDAKLFTKEFIPDSQNGSVFARLMAERAEQDGEFKSKLFRLAKGELRPTMRMLLAKTFARLQEENDLVAGLCVLRDDGTPVPYELLRSIENAFLGRGLYGTEGSNTVAPRDRIRYENVCSRWHKRTQPGHVQHLRCLDRSRCGGWSTDVPRMSRGIPRSNCKLLGRLARI